jgi:tRNA uridine 5-carbamoylmethylation protein Kti12
LFHLHKFAAHVCTSQWKFPGFHCLLMLNVCSNILQAMNFNKKKPTEARIQIHLKREFGTELPNPVATWSSTLYVTDVRRFCTQTSIQLFVRPHR